MKLLITGIAIGLGLTWGYTAEANAPAASLDAAQAANYRDGTFDREAAITDSVLVYDARTESRVEQLLGDFFEAISPVEIEPVERRPVDDFPDHRERP